MSSKTSYGSSRHVTHAQKKFVAASQHFKCNNKPGSKLVGLADYKCPLWKDEEHKGTFDISGYEVDHITEWSISKDDSLDNLQALCILCHKVKTKRFMMKKKDKCKPVTERTIEDEEDNQANNKFIYRCEYCLKNFSTAGNLKSHQKYARYCRSFQESSEIHEFICEFCGTSLASKQNLTRHILSCPDKKVYKLKSKYKTQISSLRSEVKKVRNKNKKQATEISELTETIERLEKELIEHKGIISGMKNSIDTKTT